MIIDPKQANYNIPIWRYMNFSKFINMLESSSLFFVKMNKFIDSLEGENNALNGEHIKDILTELVGIDTLEREGFTVNVHDAKKNGEEFRDKAKLAMGVSCWHMAEDESDYMWNEYTNGKEGIAIKTSVSILKKSIEEKNYSNNRTFLIGKVEYIDYEKEYSSYANLTNYLFNKNINYHHEKEFRIYSYDVLYSLEDHHRLDTNNMKLIDEVGIQVRVDYKSLLEEVIVNSKADEWFYELVKKVMRDKYGLNTLVKKSVLSETEQ